MLLVRHGETQANLDGIYHGRLDSPLTGRGREQALRIGGHLASMAGAARFRIVASPQPRAVQTAHIIADCLGSAIADILLDDRLREVSIGAWEGLSHAEIEKLEPGTFDNDGRHDWFFRAPGGEPYESFSARVADWLREFSATPSRVVVTHGIVGRVLRGIYAGLPRLEALALPIPQDRIFRLSDGAIEEILIETNGTAVRPASAEANGAQRAGS